jgi:Domain of unknown function (DUF4041)
MFSLLVAILLIGSGVWIYVLNERNTYLQECLQRYSHIASQDNFQENLSQEIQSTQQQASYFTDQCDFLEARLKDLKKEVAYLDEEAEIQSFGFYDPIYNFISSDDYIYQIKSIRQQQRSMINNGEAVSCPIGWSVGDSKKDGEKLVKNFKKLILTIFNAECDEIIKGVRLGKIAVAQAKIEKQFASLNKKSEVIRCAIDDDYLSLKIRELQLQYELEIKRQEEREMAQQIRQEEQDRKKLEKAEAEMREAEERERRYKQEIDEIQQKLESVHQEQIKLSEKQKEIMRGEIEELQKSLQEAQKDREEAESRSKSIKSGHVFIISNIGSFGRDVYRICVTRSVNEDSYISNMTPVVPFPFDIHFKFFSGDVNETIGLLHERFQDRRVNTANLRRDFFHVSFEEIAVAVNEIRQKTGKLKNFTVEEKVPNAYEYRKTQQQNQVQEPSQESKRA